MVNNSDGMKVLKQTAIIVSVEMRWDNRLGFDFKKTISLTFLY